MCHIVNKNGWIYILYGMLRLLLGKLGVTDIPNKYLVTYHRIPNRNQIRCQ